MDLGEHPKSEQGGRERGVRMIPASEDRSPTNSVQGSDPQLDSLVLSLLHAYCERIPALPSELRYLEIGGPQSPGGWRTRCVSVRMAARGVLLLPSTEHLGRLQGDRPRDIVIHGRLGDPEDNPLEAPVESLGPDAPENQGSGPLWNLDDLAEREFPFNRLDHLVVHGDPGALWGIRSCKFRVVRPYMLHVVSPRPIGREQISDAIAHLGRRDFVLIASGSRDLILLDSLAFLRPEQSSSFIV
jgi:hypothetical protein